MCKDLDNCISLMSMLSQSHRPQTKDLSARMAARLNRLSFIVNYLLVLLFSLTEPCVKHSKLTGIVLSHLLHPLCCPYLVSYDTSKPFNFQIRGHSCMYMYIFNNSWIAVLLSWRVHCNSGYLFQYAIGYIS